MTMFVYNINMKSWVLIALVWTCSLAQLIIIDNADSRWS